MYYLILMKGGQDVNIYDEVEKLLEDIEKFRTKEELKTYVIEIHKRISESEELRKLYRERIGKFKQFRQELLPLYIYSQSSYATDSKKFKLVIGNQKYDAIEKLEKGINQKIEFTESFDGLTDKKIMKELNAKGFACTTFQCKKEYMENFEENVKKKSENRYENTKIFFIYSTKTDLFDVISETEIKELQVELIKIIKKYNFEGNEVYLMTLRKDMLGKENEIQKIEC